MNLFSKRDSLTSQLSVGDSEFLLEDFDSLEREVTSMKIKCDDLKEKVGEQRKLRAEISNGI